MIAPGTSRPSSLFELRHASTDRPTFIRVPERRLLAIHGVGTRRGAGFAAASSVLHGVAEIVRQSIADHARSGPHREVIEITWPLDEASPDDRRSEKALEDPRGPWTQMIELPAAVNDEQALKAIEVARRAGGREIPLVHVLHLTEGDAAQILRIGSERISTSVGKLLRLVSDAGLSPTGDLHEIVLADPVAVGRDRARSIVRIPVASPGASERGADPSSR